MRQESGNHYPHSRYINEKKKKKTSVGSQN